MKALALALLLVSPALYAEDNSVNIYGTGNWLHKFCSHQNYEATNASWGVCMEIVYDTVGGMELGQTIDYYADKNETPNDAVGKARMEKVLGFCVPENVTREQDALVVSKYLDDHPETLNQPLVFEIWNAYRAAYPCPTK